MSRGSHYRDSTRMSSRTSFVQLVSDLQHNKKPEGEAMRYAGRYGHVVNNSWGIGGCESAIDSAIADDR